MLRDLAVGCLARSINQRPEITEEAGGGLQGDAEMSLFAEGLTLTWGGWAYGPAQGPSLSRRHDSLLSPLILRLRISYHLGEGAV